MSNEREQKLEQYLILARSKYGAEAIVTGPDMLAIAVDNGISYPYKWIKDNLCVSRGKFDLGRKPGTSVSVVAPVKAHVKVKQLKAPEVSAAIAPEQRFNPNASTDHLYADVPKKSQTFVPFGFFNDLTKILTSGNFFPVFIAGLSGNGKTLMVEQACAKSGRALVRIQMSAETDEDDLIGGYRLISGETRFIKGPVIKAMELGAVMLIDEVDRADPNKIMCIQGIMEGKPYYMKKTGEIIYPAPGFTVVVTANTKGRGSENGLYTAAKILDDAWLERFPITIEQEFPQPTIEYKILMRHADKLGADITSPELLSYIKTLTGWALVIRKSYEDDVLDNVISTRRLTHILETYLIFGEQEEAIRLCVSRYDEDTKIALIELFNKVKVPIALASTSPLVRPTIYNLLFDPRSIPSSEFSVFNQDMAVLRGTDMTEVRDFLTDARRRIGQGEPLVSIVKSTDLSSLRQFSASASVLGITTKIVSDDVSEVEVVLHFVPKSVELRALKYVRELLGDTVSMEQALDMIRCANGTKISDIILTKTAQEEDAKKFVADIDAIGASATWSYTTPKQSKA